MGNCCGHKSDPERLFKKEASEREEKVQKVDDLVDTVPEQVHCDVCTLGSEEKIIKFHKIEDSISTGDLAVLYREGQEYPHFAVFIQNSECDPNFPLLLIKGKTKPVQMFNPKNPRYAQMVSAITRIFYGDYCKVAVRHLLIDKQLDHSEVMKVVDDLDKIPFTEKEIQAVQSAATPEDRSRILCAFMVAHLYQQLGILAVHPTVLTPATLEDNLKLSDPTYIKLPPVKPGPIATTGDPPLLSKLVDGIFPPPEVETSPYISVVGDLQTGDLVLFSGATSNGAIIKFFDNSQFSHCGIVLKAKFTTQLLVWEASTNKAGLVDVDSGKVRTGVQLLPLKSMVFSGWYDRVAVRKLTGIDDEKRAEMYEQLLVFRKEMEGRPYEKSKLSLILAAFDENYLTFLRNSHEDLSSLFCSELVAAAYMRMGLIETSKLPDEFTPDDFSSDRDHELNLKIGKLEKEVYIELKFDS